MQAGAGGVLTGLEGVAGCSKGRRDRNVRHGAVTSSAKPVKCSANFLALFAQSCSAARRGSNASEATRSFLDMSYSERIHLPEGGDLAGTLGHHRGSATTSPSGTSLATTLLPCAGPKKPAGGRGLCIDFIVVHVTQ